MALQFYNTLGRKLQKFETVEENHVRMYTCGPTVYNFAHIGNFRAYVFEDLLRRFLKFKGFKVTQVMNITDVDDKTIRDSQKEKMPLKQFTDKYTAAFFEDLQTLNIEKAEVYPRATDHIQEMVAMIEELLRIGVAYKGEDKSIYFSIKKFKQYGKLNNLKLDQLKAGARVAQDEYDKEHASDFALWKAWDAADGDVAWDATFGRGRPGWHIECSAMAMKHLSNAFAQQFDPAAFITFDIHTGGVDNAFPHHEDEIAQSEAVSGKTFANYWLHCEHLLVEGKKMSKSLGNFYTLRDLVNKGYDPLAIRYLLMANAHYRQQLNFTFEALEAAKNSVKRIQEFMVKLKTAHPGKKNVHVKKHIDKLLKEFEKALDEDLNINVAMSHVFEFMRIINGEIAEGKITSEGVPSIEETMKSIDTVLGLLKEEGTLDEEIESLIAQRNEARKRKDFKESDRIRDELKAKGILLDDSGSKTVWKRA